MIDIKTLTLLPQNELLQASTLELKTWRRYRQLALRFLPYDAELSNRMTELGVACERRLEALRWAADNLGLGACVDLPALQDEPARAHPERFFVVDGATADQLLQEAMAAAMEAHRIARQLQAVNGTPELERPLLEYARQKQLECHILMESQTDQQKRA
ncbi:hypothetical protein [Halomonas nitroreducens]|uniref:DUF2383 domain-containing protein n=1 Tax=Halomonas nitroreducens TaxID=447425 RepID=A0A3S0HPA7_9GAMM|nr:hypothetical protein [Halomonas nitroreducens]RTR02453.1 hypothetical protein EKG36_12720 [Halomonas nitroreducens]